MLHCLKTVRPDFSLPIAVLMSAGDSQNVKSLGPQSLNLEQLVQDVNGKHLLKVEPLNAILDPQYFVRAVHQCTLNVLHGREADAFQNASENAGAG